VGLNSFYKLPSLIYGVLATLKNLLYDSGVLDGVRVPQKVISVGNLTMGGTGKTPVVDLILSYYRDQGVTTALVAKNYKAQLKYAAEVDRTKINGAQHYGDEAWMLAQRHPETAVFVGPQKWYSLWLASKNPKLQVIVIDDGFQHRKAERDLDIVVIDGTAKPSEYELVPSGRAREPWSSLKRADLVVISKSNWAQSEELEQLRARIKWTLPGSEVLVEAISEIDLAPFAGAKVTAFAGIGNPHQFESMLRSSGQIELRQFIGFADHQHYGSAELEKIKNSMDGSELILTTEKDFGKLKVEDFAVPLKAVPLTTKLTDGATEFYATLDSVLR